MLLKRAVLFVTIILILSIFLSSCMFFQKQENEINTNIVSVQLRSDGIRFTSNVEANGIEVILNIRDISKKNVIFSKGMLGIVTNSSTCSKISVAKLKGTFSKGEPLFIINKKLYSLSNLKIRAKYVLLPEAKALGNFVPSYPEGLSIGKVRTQVNSDTKILIHAKDLKNVSGINLTLDYDPTYLIPKEKGEKLLYPTNGMMIVKPIKPGVLDVSVAFDKPINIDDTDFLQVTFVTSNSTGTSSIKFGDGTEVLDPYLTKILCGIKNGTVVIDKTNLLGDFDGNGTVELDDFVNFAKHYDSSVGDNIYQPLYDIAPAQRAANGLWMVSQPDGVIDLKDFVVFAQNYLESVPSSAPPKTSPTNLSVSNPNSSCNSLKLSWSYNSNDENGFEIWKSTDDTHFQKILAVGTETSFTDGMLNSNTKYYYKVRAYNQGGYSPFSNIASNTTAESSSTTSNSTISYFPIHDNEVDEIQISLSNYFFGGIENSIFDPNQSLSCKEDISYFATSIDSNSIKYVLKSSGAYVGYPNKFLYLYFKVSKTSSEVYWSPNFYYPHSSQDHNDYIKIIDGINGNVPGTIYIQKNYEVISRTSYYLSQLSVGNKTYNNVLVVKLHFSSQSGGTPLEMVGYFARGIGIVKFQFYLCLEGEKVLIASAKMISQNVGTFQNSPSPAVLLSPNGKEYICSLDDVNLKWKPSGTNEKYNVYLNNEEDSIKEIKNEISATSINVGKLSAGNYIWTVTTVGSNGLSTISIPLKFSVLSPNELPNSPTNLKVTSFASTHITLEWQDNNSDWMYFAVERSTDDTNFTEISTTTNLTYNDTSVSSGVKYYYEVKAVNYAGYSQPSNVVSMKAMEDSVITFPDPNLERVIRTALNKLSGDIHISDLLTLTSLSNSWPTDQYKISNLEGIQYCTNLTRIDFSGNNISDLSPLASLTNLITLNLNGNNISNILPLQKLTNLQSLDLSCNKIKDISSLQNLTNLEWLSLVDNEISNITPLVNNNGIGNGDFVDLSSNFLDLSLTSDDMENISTLVSRGVNVSYNNQKTHPTTPYNLQIVSFSSTSIKLRWDDDNNDWTSFVIRRSTDDTNFATLTSISTTNYEDTNVLAGTTYYYEVQSCNPIGHSDWSYAVSAVATDQ